MLKKFYSSLALVAVLLLSACSSGVERNKVTVIPTPVKIVTGYGHFEVKEEVTIGVSDESLLPIAHYLKDIVKHVVTVSVVQADKPTDIYLKLNDKKTKEGAYRLTVGSDFVLAEASNYAGIISSVATIRQLLPLDLVNLDREDGLKLPILNINDSPRLEWRGMMLDSSRHFWSVAEVKDFLDLLYFYKLNKFHWHLTDDQGWRIEIKRYPLLTEKGAWRKFNSQDRDCIRFATTKDNSDYNIPEDKIKVVHGDTIYGGFYTQEELRDIVSYAGVLGIDVIPEVDMPGHFLAAISEYPEIACDGLIGWGDTFSSPICPGKDSTLEFCKNIYKEVFDIFPYEFAHLGGDEVEKNNWKKCADCQKRIKEEGLNSEEELQAWFVREMESFFNANGRRLIGWDEVGEDKLSEQAAIMWWRSWNPSAIPTATAEGKNVINTENVYLYFDYEQDKQTMRKLLAYDPIMPSLTEEQKELILGVQANVWTEWIPSVARLQYMITPRILALSEIAWVEPSEILPIDEFYSAIIPHFIRFDNMGINYRIPDIEGFYDVNVFVDKAVLELEIPLPTTVVRYTTDGSMPNASSTLYTEPLTITETTDFRFRTYRPDGTPSDVVDTKYVKSPFREAAVVDGANKQGLQAKWYNYRGNRCAEVDTAELNGQYTIETVSIPEGVSGNIGLVITGYLSIPADDIYTFALLSDDGSVLKIGDDVVIDNDGPHAPKEVISQVALKEGLHPIELRYFDHNGGILEFYRIDKKGNKEQVSREWFRH